MNNAASSDYRSSCVFPQLGHNENEESVQFMKDFFDYGLAQKAEGNNLGVDLDKQLKRLAYVADWRIISSFLPRNKPRMSFHRKLRNLPWIEARSRELGL